MLSYLTQCRDYLSLRYKYLYLYHMLRSKHLKFFMPLFFTIPLLFGVAMANDRSIGMKLWIKDNESLITILLALAIPITGWQYGKYRERVEAEQKAGREEFLHLASNKISTDITTVMTPKIELLEERIDWLYKQQSNLERDLHVISESYSDVRVNLANINADLRVLNATRKDDLDGLSYDLQAAETKLTTLLTKFDKPLIPNRAQEAIFPQQTQ